MSDPSESTAAFTTLAARVCDARAEGATIAVSASRFAGAASTVALRLSLWLEALPREPVLLVDGTWWTRRLTPDARLDERRGLTDCLRPSKPHGLHRLGVQSA